MNKDPNKHSANPRSPTRKLNVVDTETSGEVEDGDEAEEDVEEDNDDKDDEFDRLVNMATSRKSTDPLDIANVLSSRSTKKKDDWKKVALKQRKNLKVDTSVNNHTIHYRVTRVHHDVLSTLSLVDRGANGGVTGDNVRIIDKTDRCVSVSGVGDHELTNLKIVTAGGVCPTK